MSQELLEQVVEKYHPDFAFAYGSGAFPQEGHTGKRQIDFIFAVENPYEWHKQNLEEHPEDYSGIGILVLRNEVLFSKIQNMGAGIWYHIFVPFNGEEIKYGVVSIDKLKSDLQNWETLYLAGRMHKPVNILTSSELVGESLIKQNHIMALSLALLMLPEHFSKLDLYTTIAGLSYTGDSRMAVGENPDKVKNIVTLNISEFDDIYESLFDKLGLEKKPLDMIKQTKSPIELYDLFPYSVTLEKPFNDFFREVSSKEALERSLSTIVNKPTKAQSLKGFVTAGFLKSLEYAAAKVGKRFSKK